MPLWARAPKLAHIMTIFPLMVSRRRDSHMLYHKNYFCALYCGVCANEKKKHFFYAFLGHEEHIYEVPTP